MKKLWLLLLALPLCAATLVEGPTALVNGSTIVKTYPAPGLSACKADIAALAGGLKRYCRTEFTTKAEPVDCVVSAFTPGPLVPASCPASGTQSRTDTRTVVTSAANGGKACPALTQTVSVSCTPPVVTPPTSTYANQCFSPPLGMYKLCADGVMVATRATAGGYGDYSNAAPKLWENVKSTEAVYVCELSRPVNAPDVCPTGADTSARFVLKSSLQAPTQPPPPVVTPATGSATVSWSAPTQNIDGSPITVPITYRVEYGIGTFAQSVVTSSTQATITGLAAGTWQFRVIAIAGAESAPSAVGAKTIQ